MPEPTLRVQYLDKRFRVKLNEKPLSIGRLKENRLCIEIGSISRRHAVIEYIDNKWVVKDLDSSNGIVHQGKQLKKLILKKDIEFKLGDALFTALIDQDASSSENDSTVTKIVENNSKIIPRLNTNSSEIKLAKTQETPLKSLVSHNNPIKIGIEICGYRIEKKLHQDNLQTAYKAHQISIDRTVVLKILNSDHTSNPKFIEKFNRQAKISGSYNHPNIIHTLDCNQIDDLFFYAVEWVDGKNLTQVLKREKRLTISQSLDIITNIAQALSYIHQKGATHQNIKPNSIIIKENGDAKLADVGLFALFDSDANQNSRKLIGAPQYMSPEQARGQQLSDKSDVYSLGTVLYHMVTNRPPFEGDNPITIISKQIKSLPKSPKIFDITIDEQLDNLIMEMLQKDPNMRPSIDKVLDLLPDIHSAITPMHISGGNSIKIKKKRRRKIIKKKSNTATILSIIVAFIITFIALMMLNPQQRDFATKKAPWSKKIFKMIDKIHHKNTSVQIP